MPIFGTLMGFLLLSGGVAAVPARATAPVAPTLPTYSVTLTGYNAVPAQTDSDPFTTASGAYSNPEVVAARSRDLADSLPFGTIIEVSGPTAAQNSCGYGVVEGEIGYRVIADTMNAKFTDRIDVLFSTDSDYTLTGGRVRNAGTVLGICDGVTIKVVGHIDLTHPGNLPKSQAALAVLVDGNASAIALK